jgi:hypothetical protein
VSETTHVLTWIPPWLLPDGFEGYWDLQTWDNWAAGTPQPDYETLDAPPNAEAAELADWTAAQVGQPVALSPGWEQIRRHRFFGRWQNVPAYCVRPVAA